MATSSAEEVKNFEKQLKEAVEITLDPLAASQLRSNAYEFIEQFKNVSPLCADVGLRLFNKDNSPIVRHLGLQLLEHCIKFQWNTLECLQQSNLKCTSLELIAKGTKPVLEEPLYIKESLARLVVEIIKREWPQKWETLLQDLTTICNMGDTQKELVLMVFLRLAEDSISMDCHLNHQRKREITQCLHLHMEGLFTFFIETLRSSTSSMIEMKNNQSSSITQSKALIHQRVAEQALLTLQGFLDWVKFNILFIRDCILLQILCLLLDEEELKIPACECLLIIVSRKGKIDQKLEYGRLFSQDAIQLMNKAARKACNAEYSEKQYLFLKRLCQVLIALGSVQLTQLWSKERPQGKPETFKQYLETILAFTKHDSLALSHLTNTLWLVILRNDIMVADDDVKAVMPLLLQMAKTKILRVGDHNNFDGHNIFNREDFDSSKEFESVFTQVRSQVMDIVKLITQQFPVETFFQSAEWLQDNIDKTKDGLTSASKEDINELRIQWDGSCCYMTAVMSKLFTVDDINELLKNEFTFKGTSIKVLDLARNCIKSLIMINPSVCNDPSILTYVVDIIQSMLKFLMHCQDLILEVLRKIFSLVTYNTTGESKGPWSLEVLHTRRRASSALLHMCRTYGNLLVPMFDELKQYVSSLFEGELVTIQDRTTLTEALVMASNFVESESKRNDFISSLVNPHKDLLIDNRNTISLEWLIAYLGMNTDPVNYDTSEEISKQRFRLMLAFTTILAIVRKCRTLEAIQTNSSSERCSIGLMPDGSSSHDCNPCSSYVLPFLPGLLNLTQAVNKLQGNAAKSLIFPAYIASLNMHDSEKSAIFALQKSGEGERASEDNSPVTKTKRYIFLLTDSCYTILGLLGDMMGEELYKQPGLAQYVNEQVINTLHHLPNYRMRVVIRHFIKFFITRCPVQHYDGTLVPVLSHFFTFMFQHLEGEWQKVRVRKTESSVTDNEEEKDTCSQEIIEDQLVHLITKDYMDVFYIACTFKSQSTSQTEEESEPMKDEDDQETESSKKSQAATEAELGPLGEILMQTASVNMQLLSTVFGSMTWLDSSACAKAARLSIPVINKALTMAQSMGSSISSNLIEALYLQILKGIQVHGELGQSILTRVGFVLYELLKPQYPNLKEVLLQATGCPVADLEAFEDVCFGSKARSEKSKKDHFKKLVENILGKHLGEMFKEEIKIKDLPAIQFPSKPREASQEQEGSLGLAELFDPKKATNLI